MTNTDPTPPSSSDAVVIVKEDINAVETPKEFKDEYFLPEWFLARNVRSKAELDELQRSCEVVTSDGEPTSEEVSPNTIDKNDSPTTADGESQEDSSPKVSNTNGKADDLVKLDDENPTPYFQVSLDSFSELRDVTAAALVRNHMGKLPASNPSILLCWPKNDERRYVDSVLAHLAKDLQATLMAADLEDLEDLGWEFDRQEREWTTTAAEDDTNNRNQPRQEPNRDSFTGMTSHYLGGRSKAHASNESWNRNMKAIRAILDAQRAKSKQQETESKTILPETSINGPDGSGNSDSSPLLLHVRDFSDMMKESRGHRFLARLRNAVQDQRMSGRNVVFLVSIFNSNFKEGGCQCSGCKQEKCDNQAKISRKISVGQASTVTVTVTSLSDKAGQKEKDKSDMTDRKKEDAYETAQVNIRRLKRFLKWRIPHLFHPEVLDVLQSHQPFSGLEKHGFDAEYESLGVSRWSEQDVQRSVTQITGRAFGRSRIDLKDVQVVLSRLGLCGGLDNKVESGMGEEKKETWKEKLDKIESDANKFEKALMSCIINQDDLRITYDDVIMDEETKLAIRYLVSLSKFKLEAASKSLLQHIRITGALFYGPPGTGKTHLSRAVAKASGSNMLAIDSATIQSKWVGETEKYIKAAFTLSAKLYPCVLFIDEADSLFYRRSSDDKSWERSALVQFLSEMDGLLQREKNPFVIVATNRPADLDEAFFRHSRAKILQLFLAEEDLDERVDVAALARQTEGYSGSDLRNLCAEAALLWTIEQIKAVIPNEKGGEIADGQKMGKLRLESRHFAKALKKIRPSVTRQTIREFQEFAGRFNPEPPNAKANVNGLEYYNNVNRGIKLTS